MIHAREEMMVMDKTETVFKRPTNLTVLRLSLFFFLISVSVIVIGLLTYYFTACDDLPESKKTTSRDYDRSLDFKHFLSFLFFFNEKITECSFFIKFREISETKSSFHVFSLVCLTLK